MRRVAMIIALLAAFGPVAATPAAPHVLRPHLTLAGDPVVVRGYHFQAAERVKVTVFAHGTFVRRVTATSEGSFRVAFPNASLEGCGHYGVSAVGNQGSRAWLKRQVECPPPAPPFDVLMPRDPVPKNP